MVGEVSIGAGTVSPLANSSASKVSPSVARTYFALALVVAGLAFSAANVFVTSPGYFGFGLKHAVALVNQSSYGS